LSRRRRPGWRAHPLARVGPGLITGVADDDPGGIATYSQAGAAIGLQLLWTMPFAFPLMAAMQSLCARIGRVTGKGLAANIRSHFPPGVLYAVVGLLVVANTLNIAADVAAMGEAAALVTGVDRHLLTTLLVLLSVLLQVFVPYHRYVKFLKWLTLSLLAYAGVLFTVEVPWRAVLVHSLWPQMALNKESLAMVVALLGTTICPYLFFWQASEEVEDLGRRRRARALIDSPAAAPRELRRIAWDTWSGMFYSNVTAWMVMLVTAVTLHAAGVTTVTTAAKAAEALRPLAGEFAFGLFALGIVGVGLIGVPVLAGSAAYAVAEALGWRSGLERSLREAPRFYTVLAASVLVGLVAQYLPIPPLQALFYSAVINGVVAVPLMVVILSLVRRPAVMGAFVVRGISLWLGWLAVAVMGLAAVLMFALA
jgi:NRAMP (natural resistance-associated macrophage protein)-like metal ion transporter